MGVAGEKLTTPASGDVAAGAAPAVRHVAIIMDGNGRWATRRGLPRAEGHRRGVEALRRTVRAAVDIGLQYLTVYSFSSENWRRPAAEVGALMGLLRLFFRRDLADLERINVRVRFIGERGGLQDDVRAILDEAERRTARNTGLNLVVAFNYGGRQEIAAAARRIAELAAAGELKPEDVGEELVGRMLDTTGMPDPDLVIRTSGEIRTSNFLPWQTAYSEYVFTPVLWPDFDGEALGAAIAEFTRRDRRFGGVGETGVQTGGGEEA
ncbi:isoprenyl transferase [Camelimonas lactis]|uniref:Isoprenyl transferase n=1 Tax=Camelimonas lactis TaxID=659006 RepID=A0A4R2GZA1_9HYPH|nr:undecaprenyl diphosphate synthase [Camelimonas lactis]